jgi:hypothetical protein
MTQCSLLRLLVAIFITVYSNSFAMQDNNPPKDQMPEEGVNENSINLKPWLERVSQSVVVRNKSNPTACHSHHLHGIVTSLFIVFSFSGKPTELVFICPM